MANIFKQESVARLTFSASQSPTSISSSSNPSYVESSTPAVAITLENLNTFLQLVADGKQDEAETMIEKNPALALAKGDVVDHADRKFEQITALQYATWALDWYMWRMLLKYIPKEAANTQAVEFKTGPWVTTHGEHAGKTIQTLIANEFYSDILPH